MRWNDPRSQRSEGRAQGPKPLRRDGQDRGRHFVAWSVRGGVGVGSVTVILVLGISLFLVDGGDLRMADAFDLMTVRKMGMMGGADMIVVRIGFGGLGVLMCGDGEVVGGLAVAARSSSCSRLVTMGVSLSRNRVRWYRHGGHQSTEWSRDPRDDMRRDCELSPVRRYVIGTFAIIRFFMSQNDEWGTTKFFKTAKCIAW